MHPTRFRIIGLRSSADGWWWALGGQAEASKAQDSANIYEAVSGSRIHGLSELVLTLVIRLERILADRLALVIPIISAALHISSSSWGCGILVKSFLRLLGMTTRKVNCILLASNFHSCEALPSIAWVWIKSPRYAWRQFTQSLWACLSRLPVSLLESGPWFEAADLKALFHLYFPRCANP